MRRTKRTSSTPPCGSERFTGTVPPGSTSTCSKLAEGSCASLSACLSQTSTLESAPASQGEPDLVPAPDGSPEDALDFRDTQKRVVLFGYPEDDATNRVAALFTAAGVVFRRQNLHQQPREAQQIASMTGVMVPPYVYIHGRFWGGEGEMESLLALGELQRIIDNRLDELSPEARRIGKLRESFDDVLSVDNILHRLRRGHILSVDGLDCWFEAGAVPRFFYDGAPRPVDEMPAIAAEIARRGESGDCETRWLFEPSVGV